MSDRFRQVAPALLSRRARAARAHSRKEHAMMLAFVIAPVALAVLAVLSRAAERG